MPKRILDGEAFWESARIRRLQLKHRGEFANLYCLAEANGVFEVDLRRIWRRVYSYLRDDISEADVAEIVADMIAVGLLVVWEEDGKLWGVWDRSDKPGRLPGPVELKKYKNLPPDPPVPLETTPEEGLRLLAEHSQSCR